jgi:hypothetical protein
LAEKWLSNHLKSSANATATLYRIIKETNRLKIFNPAICRLGEVYNATFMKQGNNSGSSSSKKIE